MRLLLDTSVVAAALQSRFGASNAVLRLGLQRRFTLLASTSLFLEYEDVLLRPEQRIAHGLSIYQVHEFLEELAGAIEPVEIHFQWRPQVTDTGGEMVLEAVINGSAAAPVTHNIRHFAPVALRFQLLVVTPTASIEGDRIMNSSTHKSTYPLKLPTSIKKAAQRLAKEDGVSLNQWISVAVAQKVGTVETAAAFFTARANGKNGSGLMKFLENAPAVDPEEIDKL